MYENLIDTLYQTRDLPDDALIQLIDAEDTAYLRTRALERRRQYYGEDVFMRGLIEFTNYCRNNCYYCGLRAQNAKVFRYRLSPEEIFACADEGYALGLRTFVLQGGEDPSFDEAQIAEIVSTLVSRHPDCAVTLAVGEQSRETYQRWYAAGARRYLLRHETADAAHYQKLHPASMRLDNRMRCLHDLKEIGYQVGAGFMVGSPAQTLSSILADLRFLQSFGPDMIGVGPFIPQADTPFGNEPPGSVNRTLNLLSILRLMFPYALIPSTTALGTLDPHGRELGLLAGANVVMPNLTPLRCRKHYAIYDNKICTDEESAQCKIQLAKRIASVGFRLTVDRGDVRKHRDKPTP